VGARNDAVYHVTTLADSGPGSLRDALSMPNRTVVFEVGGVIELSERLIFLNNQTIAGQTAPGGGITLYGNGTSFTNANHTIVRYVRFRMGLGGDSGKDTITIARGHDMIFDHCSISWGRDGNFDLNQESGYELADITLQDSIVAQGLQTHSTGGLINASGVSVLRSLWIDNNSRNPKARQTLQWVNNIVYNWVASGFILGDTSGRSDGYLVGNYFITGPETNGGTLDSPTDAYHVYAAGNYYDSDENGALDGRLLTQGDFGTASFETSPSADFPAVTELSAAAAFEHVVANAGASLFRDAADEYVVAELVSLGREGATISDEASLALSNVVGDVPGGTAPADVDRDGMADAWELANELDPGDADDRNGDRNGDGWTNLEEYVNSRAAR
jgi:pectate lyase